MLFRERFAATLFLALTLLLCGCAPPPAIVSETLPGHLTNQEFFAMITDFSEPGGYFRSDNFLSNESGYQEVIPVLLKTMRPSGVYIGVGPEQNFTYMVAFRPKIAFIIDIRRQNMLEHLFYKALMEISADRAEFLSRLFARPQVAGPTNDSTPATLLRAFQSSRPQAAFFEENIRRVIEYLENQKSFPLSDADVAGIRRIAKAFFKSGPDLSYTFIGAYGDGRRMPTYFDLITETDGVQNWNFLATENQFQIVQRMQKDNLIVPLVGDFAGMKTIRAVAEYAEKHRSSIRAFYTSNVEEYLFQDNENWKRFYDNVAFLPTDSTSAFIRYVLNGWAHGHHRTTVTSPMNFTIDAYRSGRIQAYVDIVRLSR